MSKSLGGRGSGGFVEQGGIKWLRRVGENDLVALSSGVGTDGNVYLIKPCNAGPNLSKRSLISAQAGCKSGESLASFSTAIAINWQSIREASSG